MKTNKRYESPRVDFLDVVTEGVLCASKGQMEDVFEHEGSWGTLMLLSTIGD